MKKKLIFYSNVFVILLLIIAACTRQKQGNTPANITGVRNDMNLVLDKIDEAIAATEIPDFRDKTVDAVRGLDKHIEDYIDGMYKNEKKINEESRNVILGIKQKKVEVEFKLALIEKEIKGDNSSLSHTDTILTSANASGSAHGKSDMAVKGNASGGNEPVKRRSATDNTTTEINSSESAMVDAETNTQNDLEPITVEGLHDEIIIDLQQLRKDISYFLQASLEEEF